MADAESHFDIIVVGAGIVGASIAFHAAPYQRVLVLEGEAAAGYHTTGRSAALFTETYGPPAVRCLTRASRAFFERPPAGFAKSPLLAPRGTLLPGSSAQRGRVHQLFKTLRAEGAKVRWLEGDAVRSMVPVLRPDASAVAVHDPDAFDIDVDALLQGFMRGACTRGARVVMSARVEDIRRREARWVATTHDGRSFQADRIVNAAGAWVDEVAASAGVPPIGIEPRRRSAFLFHPPDGEHCDSWPAVVAIDESWYFKPDAGLLLGSPANADLDRPHDVVAEEMDVALGIYNIEQATTLTIRRPKSTWAGLRCFVSDGEPVCGFEPSVPGFFWAAALGGYGIQSAPAVGRLCAALLRGDAMPEDITAQGLDLAALAPRRSPT
jgi:D-arginine dehydrogenase